MTSLSSLPPSFLFSLSLSHTHTPVSNPASNTKHKRFKLTRQLVTQRAGTINPSCEHPVGRETWRNISKTVKAFLLIAKKLWFLWYCQGIPALVPLGICTQACTNPPSDGIFTRLAWVPAHVTR